MQPASLIEPTGAENITLTVSITNTGQVGGLATVGVYHSRGLSRFVRFHKMLTGFAKLQVPLAPGATVALPVTFRAESLATWDPQAKEYVIEPGEYDLSFGEDSVTERGLVRFVVASDSYSNWI